MERIITRNSTRIPNIVFVFIVSVLMIWAWGSDWRDNEKAPADGLTLQNMSFLQLRQSAESIREDADISAYNTKVRKNQKIAYLTFDDGPSQNITVSILNTLKSNGIKATFFVLPKSNLDNVYKRILDEGHVIGNHSYTHNYSYLYNSVANFKKDLLKSDRFIYNKFHYKTAIYRFPGGSIGRNKGMIRIRAAILEKLGYKYFDWNVSVGDADPRIYKTGTEEQIVSRMVNNVVCNTGNKQRLIVLMHDNGSKIYTAKALPKIISELKKQGYTFDVLTSF